MAVVCTVSFAGSETVLQTHPDALPREKGRLYVVVEEQRRHLAKVGGRSLHVGRQGGYMCQPINDDSRVRV